MKKILLVVFVSFSFNVFSQDINDRPPKPLNFSDIGKSIVYPDSAKKNNIEGRVTIKLAVSETGNVISAEDYKGDSVFYNVIIESVFKLKFEPAIENNVRVKAWVLFPFNFVLPKQEIEKEDK